MKIALSTLLLLTALSAAPQEPARPMPRPGGPGGPGGGIGNFLAPQILAALDANKDGRISPDEAGAAAELFVRRADEGKTGSIDTPALAQALNRRMGGPPGMRGPGGRGGPGGPGGPPSGRGRRGGPGGFGPGNFLAPQILKAGDLNKDGHLTAEEALEAAAQFVRDADTAKAGTIGVEELRTALNKQITGPGPGGPGGPGGPPGGFAGGDSLAPKILAAADANKDGRISPDEAADAAARFVREEDREKDGLIDFETFYRALNRRTGHGAPLGLGTPEFPARGHGPGDMQAIGLLELADSDKDGRLSPDEAARAAAKVVREADADRKGSIDAETLGRALDRLTRPDFGGPGPDEPGPDGPGPGPRP